MGKKILYAILLILSAYLCFWLYQNYSWVEEQKEVGFQGIAKRQPLLAAEFFLRKMGLHSQSVNGLMAFRDMHKGPDSILIATRRETLNTKLNNKLLQWLNNGGHLIVQARYCTDENRQEQADFIYQKFGLCVKPIKEQEDETDTLKISLNNSSESTDIDVYFPYWEVLVQQPPGSAKGQADYDLNWKIADKFGLYALQFAVGQGQLTVLTTTDIFTNEYIEQYDHARFLLQLVQSQDALNSVWLVSVDDMPSLWSWLWQNAWYVMVSLSLLFVLWLWRYPLRFGPVLDDPPIQRRQLLEHIKASAYYRWHYKQLPRLLAAVQEQLWEQIQQLHPVIHRDDKQQAFALLEGITRIKQDKIEAALTPSEKINEAEFEQKIKLLASLKNKL